MADTRSEQGTEEQKGPTTLRGYLTGLGPGLVVALAWLGTGDLVDSSVSGANYGYALMWVLAIALIARFFFVNALGKYQLCNRHGDVAVLRGFRRLWRGLPLLVGIGAFMLGFVYNSYLVRAAGTGLYHLFGQFGGTWGIFIWSVVAVCIVIGIALRGNQYTIIEWIARTAAVLLISVFLLTAILQGVNVGEFLRGLAFQLPPREGLFSSILVAVALIGGVGGSAANLLYPYFMQSKGWTAPAYRKLQVLDILTGVMAILIINLLVWSAAAEALRGTGRTIASAEDLDFMMRTAIGSLGPPLLWIAIFFVAMTSVPAYSFGFAKLLIDSVHQTFLARGERYQGVPENDPALRAVQIAILLIVPLIFAMPFAPDFVVLTVIGSALGVLTIPPIIIGTIMLTSSRRHMLPEYVNRWWETAILVIVGAIGFWGIYGLISGLIDLFA